MQLMMNKVNEDDRGAIYSIPLDADEDLAVLVTKKGYARGGHSHPNTLEFFVVVKGMVNYIVDDKETVYVEGNSGHILGNKPHILLSLEDSILIHWGAKKTVTDKKYREIVDKINLKKQLEELNG
ncbi:MAG: cupin domain-containing protein [Candidatus Aenigmarchaeota archaeon]|nr:cupin domain-containing protein [Candidatus Aenigmarchaeota archaeon]